MSKQEQSPSELSRNVVYSGRFLELQTISWRDGQGRERGWETAERVGGCGAVLIIARLASSGQLVLIRQYRPPARSTVIEFPAGLIDPGETPQESALRELLEETGYVGVIQSMSPPVFNSPGLSGETVHVVQVEIDDSLAENRNPVAKTEPGEEIEVVLVAPKELQSFLEHEWAAGGQVDSKVVTCSIGLL